MLRVSVARFHPEWLFYHLLTVNGAGFPVKFVEVLLMVFPRLRTVPEAECLVRFHFLHISENLFLLYVPSIESAAKDPSRLNTHLIRVSDGIL